MEINDRNKNKKINIAKLPKYLGNYLSNIKREMEIGELNVENDGRISLVIFDKTGSNIPTHYNVKQVDRSSSDIYVLASTQDSSAVEGVVDNELLVTPVINRKYIEYKKEHANKLENTTETIDSLGEGIRMEKFGNLREMEVLAKKRKQMLIDKKRERLDKNEVLNIVFNAFEKYENWTVRDLADFTGQPTAFIQEIVNEICNVDKKDHKSIYSLKDEYK
ncbi:transcription initiation factor IIF subunit 2 (GTF2F2) [Vairimorpha necatrix]|uniref:Transcription initiation factor IIF subunit beta n=1 Tax=Vairimorpha necatrix TaxID=6039 RepID=A0AAX4J927_9MICR